MKTNIKESSLFALLGVIILSIISCTSDSERKEKEDQRFYAVRTFADNVLDSGIDIWSGKNTPLLCDGINIETNETISPQNMATTWRLKKNT